MTEWKGSCRKTQLTCSPSEYVHDTVKRSMIARVGGGGDVEVKHRGFEGNENTLYIT